MSRLLLSSILPTGVFSDRSIGDVRELNKLVRVLKATEIELRLWPLKGPLRILGYPDASYRNNDDKSSQRAHVIFLAEQRNPNLKSKDLSAKAESSKNKQFKGNPKYRKLPLKEALSTMSRIRSQRQLCRPQSPNLAH